MGYKAVAPFRARSSLASGFTLVELLVCCAVVLLLFALSLPALNSAREASHKIGCGANLRQLGIGLHSYQAAHRMLPPASLAMGPPASSFSVQYYLLPHLAYSVEYEAVDANAPVTPWMHWPMNETADVRIAQFVCPSEVNGRLWRCANSYRICTGPTPLAFFLDRRSPGGPFEFYRALSVDAFADGAQHTCLMSERVLGNGDSLRFDPPLNLWFTHNNENNNLSDDDALRYFPGACVFPPPNTPTSPWHESRMGQGWICNGYIATAYNHVETPNSAILDCAMDHPDSANRAVVSARSYHSGHVNALFADGAVRSINESVDQAIWRALATRSGSDNR